MRSTVLFLDIDGVLCINKHMPERVQDFTPLPNNIQFVRELHAQGAYIVLTTAREEEERDATLKQLDTHQVPYHQIVMGLPHHSQRIAVQDFSDTNPFPAVLAVNLQRNSDNLQEIYESTTAEN